MIGALRRNTELGLVLLGGVITAAIYTLASLGRTASLPADIGPFLGVVLGLVLEPTVPAALQPYLPIAVVAALDAVFGAVPGPGVRERV